eukprot:evm.model.scf_417.1 EVM.evm.TU.scf_417.1   scf_417:33077-33856(-)
MHSTVTETTGSRGVPWTCFSACGEAQGAMPRGPEPKLPLTDKEKLQLKQRGDNLRRRQGIGSAKYAEFFFEHRRSYPFTRKTYPVLGGRVEPGNDEWDGVDPETCEVADWLKGENTELRRGIERPGVADDLDGGQQRVSQRPKRPRTPEADEGPSNGHAAPADGGEVRVKEESWEGGGGPQRNGESQRTLQRDLKVLMDALRQIPTPRRAALAIEGMLAKPEVQYALEKFGTGSEFGLTRKELAAVSVLSKTLVYREPS